MKQINGRSILVSIAVIVFFLWLSKQNLQLPIPRQEVDLGIGIIALTTAAGEIYLGYRDRQRGISYLLIALMIFLGLPRILTTLGIDPTISTERFGSSATIIIVVIMLIFIVASLLEIGRIWRWLKQRKH